MILPAWLPSVSTLAAGVVAGVVVGGACAWLWQENSYTRQLAEQSTGYVRQLKELGEGYARERAEAAAAALDQLTQQRDQRRALEERLDLQARTHSKELNDAQKSQARLRDQLATSDLRLSVLVDRTTVAGASCNGRLRESPGAAGVVHGAIRADLDPAHAQRIVRITDEGDRGLIALKACQVYVNEITK
ncbi:MULTISPECIES: lysis system i-spanin subunit Rz [unclassified Pseudomonas]|uniref:lysis system i-spanin subunit Rz n=1 Tax=unclassified Pseudomonas TaxID=196821 RepID=UPI0025EE6498|nr:MULTISPECIES: lysis system i-spanin subunit Rz [unclassified Pseudomonas]